MKEFVIDGVKVSSTIENFTEKEAAAYVEFVTSRTKSHVGGITVTPCDDGNVDVSYYAEGTKFERIRRITGYCATRLYMKSMHAA